MPKPIFISGAALTLEEVEAVARQGRHVSLDASAARAVGAAREIVERQARGPGAVYGVNTGFGSLARQRIDSQDVEQVQRNLIRSHAAGVGEPLSDPTVRGMLVILAASLARGHSGVRVELIERILDLLNHHVTPIVPSRGSVGASGDLAPLSHAALVLMGEGEAHVGGERVSGGAALKQAGLEPLTLGAKEGLALINGTHLMTAIGALTLVDAGRLIGAALASVAMAVDACRGTDTCFDPRIHQARNQHHQMEVARVIAGHLQGSQILDDHRDDDPRVQDPYCLRATPQVLGAALDQIAFVHQIIERELGAVTDNPLVFSDNGGDILSGGNFHGMPLAVALDSLSIALCHVAGIAERRIYWLLTASDSENPVNAHLSPQPGLHSGYMIVQYTAAACCNELQTLATPASVANIPTSAGMEDYNSMGATAAHQAASAISLARHVIACELLVMAEAMEHQRPLRSGVEVEATHARVRAVVPKLTEDRPPAPDLAQLADLISRGELGCWKPAAGGPGSVAEVSHKG